MTLRERFEMAEKLFKGTRVGAACAWMGARRDAESVALYLRSENLDVELMPAGEGYALNVRRTRHG